MRVVLIFLMLLAYLHIQAQKKSCNNCIAFNSAITHPNFAKNFYLADSDVQRFVLIDTNNYLKNCNVEGVENLKFRIKKTWPEKIDNRMLVVLCEEKNKRDFSVAFWSPSNGSAVIFRFLRKRKQIILIESKLGVY